MLISSPNNGFLSNDNFCATYLRVRIDNANKLHLTAHMRSNDVFFGTVYDVPFFVFVQLALVDQLKSQYPKLTLGTYTHFANSLHMYERNKEELECAINNPGSYEAMVGFNTVFQELVESGLKTVNNLIGRRYFMAKAWEASKQSTCLKKKVAACFTITENDVERVLVTGHGGVEGPECVRCLRDDPGELFYGDACKSVHAEIRCLERLRGKVIDFSKVNAYVTHGPCDNCFKMLSMVGINKIYFDVPYKVDHVTRWPELDVAQLEVGEC